MISQVTARKRGSVGHSPEVSYLAWPLMRFWSAQRSSFFSVSEPGQCYRLSCLPKRMSMTAMLSVLAFFWNFLFKKRVCTKKHAMWTGFREYRMRQRKIECFVVTNKLIGNLSSNNCGSMLMNCETELPSCMSWNGGCGTKIRRTVDRRQTLNLPNCYYLKSYTVLYGSLW